MKPRAILSMFAVVALIGCATQFKVTLSHTTEIYAGTLTFDGPYTGELAIPNGPDGESFIGHYVATDLTPGVIAVGGTGQIEARGVWMGDEATVVPQLPRR